MSAKKKLAAIVAVALVILSASETWAANSQNFESIIEDSPLTTDRDRALLYGGCDESPFPYLEARHRGDRTNSFVTPRETSGYSAKLGLDSALACRLAKLLQAMEQQGCQLTITSAMRPTQRCNPGGGACAPQGYSCHQYGKSVDLGGSATCLDLLTRTVGRKNSGSSFGLHVAYVENGNYRHVQCAEHLQASCTPQTPPCRGGLQITPDPAAVARSPSSNIANAIRNYFNPMQQQPIAQQPQQMCTLSDGRSVPCSSIANLGGSPIPPGALSPQGAPPPVGIQNTTPYAPGTCAPQFYCQNNNLYYRSSACVDQLNQMCPKGCSGASCAGSLPTSDALGSALSDLGSTSLATERRSTSSLSAFEQISLLIQPEAVGSAATTTPFELVVSGSEATRLAGNPPLPGALAPPPAVYLTPLGSQQTFTSGDLSANFSSEPSVAQTQTTLSIMRETLLRILAYLRPFGRPVEEHLRFE